MDGQLTLRPAASIASPLDQAIQDIHRTRRSMLHDLGIKLRAMRDSRVYKERYDTFEECCAIEFGWTRPRVYQLIEAANVLDEMSTMVDILPSRERHIRELVKIEDSARRIEVWERVVDASQRDGQVITAKLVEQEVNRKLAELAKTYITVDEWGVLSEQDQRRALAGYASNKTFNQTNDNISWAAWSWNPVTGCKHGCVYCYADDIAHRFYPQGFAPSFHPDRLAMPQNTKPAQSLNGRVFVCSMADLFGEWVPDEWIDVVIEKVRASPQWRFVFLTKNPERLLGINWPDNARVGTTVDSQARVSRAENAFVAIDAPFTFVSCEPLRERVTFQQPELFDAFIVGAQSKSSRCPEMQPEYEWVEHLQYQARAAGATWYVKPNLTVRSMELPDGF